MGEPVSTGRELRILPALQRIQHEHGYLDRDELRRFAERSGIPLARLQEVGSYFPSFRFSKPPTVALGVCRDMSCHLAGSEEILRDLGAAAADGLHVAGVSCLGRCDRAPAAQVIVTRQHADPARSAPEPPAELYYLGRSASELSRIVRQCLDGAPPRADLDADLPDATERWDIDPYRGRPSDYAAVKKALMARDRAPDEWAATLLVELGEGGAALRGLGGAGVSAARKWSDVRTAVRNARRDHTDDRAFIVVNADESEPGTFKDRELLLRAPHLVVEAVILAGLVTEATEAFIYIRHEYGEQIEACRSEIRRAEDLGLCGARAPALGRPFPVSVFVSPGGYICGEQSALVEAMSDRRAEPRTMPPSLETNGLDDLPTLVSNVETFAWLPYIWLNGGGRYAALGVNGWRGRRFVSISGDVERPGVYEAPMGLTLGELVHGADYGRGLRGGQRLKAIAPSGACGGFLPPRFRLEPAQLEGPTWRAFAGRHGLDPAIAEIDVLDLELELELFRELSPTKMLGAGLVIYGEDRDMAEQAVNVLRFFRNESCGKCVPCRVGSGKMAALGGHLLAGRIEAERWRADLVPALKELGQVMTDTSICGLGRAVQLPIVTLIDYFDADVARRLAGGDGAVEALGR